MRKLLQKCEILTVQFSISRNQFLFQKNKLRQEREERRKTADPRYCDFK